jgi:hypothetical protein
MSYCASCAGCKIAVPPGAVRAFVNSHASAQVFHPAPRSNGHIISFAPHCVYQIDLLDQSGRNPAENEGYRYGLMVVDVYSRKLAGVLLRTKAPAETVGAFRRACTVLGGFPKTLYSDEGGEFSGAFDAFARAHDIQRVIRDQRHTNALAVVDSLIGRVRRAMAREMVESGSESWVGAFRKACDAMNRRPLDHLLGREARRCRRQPRTAVQPRTTRRANRPGDSPSQLRAQAEALREAGAFRTLLLRADSTRPGSPSGPLRCTSWLRWRTGGRLGLTGAGQAAVCSTCL